MRQRERFKPRRGESPEDAFVRIYEKRYGNVVSAENADELVIEMLDDQSARPILLALYPELAGHYLRPTSGGRITDGHADGRRKQRRVPTRETTD